MQHIESLYNVVAYILYCTILYILLSLSLLRLFFFVFVATILLFKMIVAYSISVDGVSPTGCFFFFFFIHQFFLSLFHVYPNS